MSLWKRFSIICPAPRNNVNVCLLSFSAPLTDKPPKILFPLENKISNMELQLGKICSAGISSCVACRMTPDRPPQHAWMLADAVFAGKRSVDEVF